MSDRPDRMKIRGRKPDPNFNDPGEPLYRRLAPEDVNGSRVSPNRILWRNMSVNRGRYSEPADVIFDHPGYGFAELTVGDAHSLGSCLPQDVSPNRYEFRMAHTPAHDDGKEQYAHSEMKTLKNGEVYDPPRIKNKAIKTRIRIELSNRMRILRMPKADA